MPKLEQFSIEFFENVYGVFNAGATIAGKVVLVVNEGMKARNIRLLFSGEANTKWAESSGSPSNAPITVEYKGHEQYLSHDLVLWGNPPETSNENPIIQPGRHEFDFTFILPVNCPTSFEGKYGNVRYYMKGIIEKAHPIIIDTSSMQRPITVIGLQDLNMDPKAVLPIQINTEETLGFWCCKAGNISLAIKIPRRGFVGGESIPVHLVIQNDTSREIKKISLRLLQCAEFRAGATKYGSGWALKHSEKEVLEWALNGNGNGNGNCNHIVMTIPSVPPMFRCGIINLWYCVEAMVTPSGPSVSLRGRLPITIGSVPLRQLFGPQPQQPMPQMPSMPQPSAPPQLQPSEYDRSPPRYEKSVFGKSKIREKVYKEHTRVQLHWTPRYPMFGNGK